MGELAQELARHLVWRAALLQVARVQGLQDAHPGAAVQVPGVHRVRGLRRHPAQARRDAVAHRAALDPRPDAAADRARARLHRRAGAARAGGRSDRAAADRAALAPALPVRGRAVLPYPGSPVAHALGRRGAAHQPHHRARYLAGQHPVRARRALDRAAPARHGTRDRGHAAAARRGQLAGGGRARPADHVRRRPHPRHGAGPGRARRRGGVLRRAAGAQSARHPDSELSLGEETRGRRHRAIFNWKRIPSCRRGERAQSEAPRRFDSAPAPRVHHRRVGLGQVDPGAGRALPRAAQGQGQADRDAGRAPRALRRGEGVRGGNGRPVADRQDDALQPGELRRRLGRDPQPVRPHTPGEGAQVHARHVQLQRRQRPLRDLRRQRLRARRDAVPVRRLPALPGLRRQALPARGARGRAARPQHLRRARDDRVRGARVLRRRARGRGAPRAARRRRPGVPAARPAGADPVRRRSAAPQARRPPDAGEIGVRVE